MQQQSHDFVIRFAGEGGQGVVTSADALARAASQVGYHVQTFSTFPSQILGGPTMSQVRISTTPVLSAGDEVDVLVAFNQYAYDNHQADLTATGVTIYNSEEFDLPVGGQYFGIKVDELAKTTGNARAANMIVLGAVADLIEMPLEYIDGFIRKRFTRGRAGDDEIIEANIKAIRLGVAEADKSGFHVGDLAAPNQPGYKQIMITGNAAIALGAAAAGLDFYVGYPISPATTILVWMEDNLIGKDKFAYQVSSEIEAISAIVGAGFAGKKSMTATAGPGLSLMSEGLGLAWMAEIPCVVVDVQRGGPATGLPTKTEQSDLFACMHPAHGDVKLPVIAPGTVEECFYAGAKAVNWAERYQGPVIVISEFQQAERMQNIVAPDLAKVQVESRVAYTGSNGFKRYQSWTGGNELTPMPVPGGPGAYVANGSEHDEIGDTTHLAAHHVRLTERRFGKLGLLNDGEYEVDNPDSPVAVMPWGASKGVAQEAYNALRAEEIDIGWTYSMFLHPLPAELLEVLKKKELIIVPELNYQGQWSSMLRSMGLRAESITQYTGMPFKAGVLADRLRDRVQQHQEGKVPA
ncbi:MAG: 2-oxoacid:acceptor oxidoreductase subunit alpha [Dehalococcoidia bacterium]